MLKNLSIVIIFSVHLLIIVDSVHVDVPENILTSDFENAIDKTVQHPVINFDDESVPQIPFDVAVTDFEGLHFITKNENLSSDGCYRSKPREKKEEKHTASKSVGTTDKIESVQQGKETETNSLCVEYQGIVPQLNEFSNGENGDWLAMVTSEIYSKASGNLVVYKIIYFIKKQVVPNLLINKSFHCQAAQLSVDLRLDDASEGGIAFRIPKSHETEYLAVLAQAINWEESLKGKLSVQYRAKNRFEILTAKDIRDFAPGVLNRLTVRDYGESNLISVLVNDDIHFNVTLDTKLYPNYSPYNRAGLLLKSGNAAYSNINFTNLIPLTPPMV